MAIAITINRVDNTIRVSAGGADTGKLRIQYNGTDIYNNLSGASNDITAGAEKSIAIPLNSSGNIPLGLYRVDFDASAGVSADDTINFQIADLVPVLEYDVNPLSPSLRVDDETDYSISNGTISSASRTILTEYPKGITISDLSTTASDITTDLFNSTYVLYTGTFQTTLTASLTYTIAATGSYVAFTYTTSLSGSHDSPNQNLLDLPGLYACINTLWGKVNTARTEDRSSYDTLQANYAYATGLLSQYSAAVNTNNQEDLSGLVSEIERVTGCKLSSVSPTSNAPQRIFGIGLASQVNNVLKARIQITAAQMVALNTTPIKVVDTDADYIYTPLGGSIACVTAPASGTPSAPLGLAIHLGSAYDTDEEFMTTSMPTTIDAAGDFTNFQVAVDKLSQGAEGIYVGADSDDPDWDGVFDLVFYYGISKV